MSEKIEPALTPEEWAKVVAEHTETPFSAPTSIYYDLIGGNPDGCAEIIALNNFVLPHDDPRKITREKLKVMRAAADSIKDEFGIGHDDEYSTLYSLADALESYLPPE